MRIIPDACGPLVLPDGCFDGLYMLGDELVDIGLTAIQPFFPALPGDCTFPGFVGFGDRPQPDDQCNQLTALLQWIDRVPVGPPNACITRWSTSWRIEVVFLVYPHVEDMNVKIFLPSIEEQEVANRWLLAVGAALADGYGSAFNAPSGPALIATDSRSMGRLKPSGPRGLCAGWNFEATIMLTGLS